MNLYGGWFFVVSGSSFSSTRSGVWPPNCWKLHMSVNFLVLNSRNFLLCSSGLQIMVVGHMECLHSQEESDGISTHGFLESIFNKNSNVHR